jgi:N-acetylmuramoyl-L-alanine amidase
MKKFITLLLLFSIIFQPNVLALSKRGSRGTEVRNIQSRLSKWGYNPGAVDGIYGAKTEAAVKRFQRNNGLTPDGIAGPATLAKIGLPTGSSSSSYQSNVNLLARVISGEARGESYTGQVAIAAVVLNRVNHSSFPSTIAGVIYQPGAFTAVSDGQINITPPQSCYNAARDALNGWDPTYGAIYYYNPVTATNSWIRTRKVITTIGKHVFCA